MKSIVYLLSIYLLINSSTLLMGQSVYRNQEFSFQNDNDAYTFRDSDKYYSNGIILNYRWIVHPGEFLSPSNLPDSSKVIIETEMSYNHFTPGRLSLTNPDNFDRPYAGTICLGYHVKVFPRHNKEIDYGMDLALIGAASGAGVFQEWYHETFGFPIPKGWDYQIPSELTVNFKAAYKRQFKLISDRIDLISESATTLGTALINAKQMVDLRFGRLHSLDFSSFTNSLIGRSSRSFLHQSYFFAGIGVEYVAHNITIEGSLWNDNAPHTERTIPWVRHMRFGAIFNSENTTFSFVYNWLGPEVKNLSWHSYVSLGLHLRFEPKNHRRKTPNS